MRSALLWDITQGRQVIPYQRFGQLIGPETPVRYCHSVPQNSSELVYMAAEVCSHDFVLISCKMGIILRFFVLRYLTAVVRCYCRYHNANIS